MLSKGSIRNLIKQLVTDLESGNLEAAADTLESLEFDRLLRPIPDPSKSPSPAILPWKELGLNGVCVSDVGAHLEEVGYSIQIGDTKPALTKAQRALERWDRG
jgi:hypothetical protein